MAQVNVDGYMMNVDVCEAVLPMDTVFIHGNLASNTWWEPTLKILKNQSRPGLEGRFIAAEWRGCGKSQPPKSDDDLAIANLANDYVQLCTTLKVKKTCIVAHSTGGLIALFAMLQAPELFDRVVLLDSVGASGVQFGPEMFAAFSQMSESRAVCETVMNSTIHNNDPQSPLFQRIVDDAFGISKMNWHGVPNALQKANIEKDIRKIQNKILVLHGEHDPIIPPDSSRVLAAGLPNAKLEILSNQGHSCNVENPSLFVAKVNEFLFQRA